MAYLLAGAAVVIALLWLAKLYARANPAQLAPLIRRTLGGGCILLAGFLTLRGALPIAIPLFLAGLALLGVRGPLSGLGFPGTKTPGQRSTVRTSMLAMELDHDTGSMDGEVLTGIFAGRKLSTLDLQSLLRLREECQAAGDQSEALLEAYLDRAHSAWRGAGEKAETNDAPRAAASTMTVEEARAILGLGSGATQADIRAAHRRLMKQYHPDQGGSDYLAQKINQAKDLHLKHAV
ncbi:MAG: DnaJ domain-containing protein [Parvibaculaceae bacterium]